MNIMKMFKGGVLSLMDFMNGNHRHEVTPVKINKNGIIDITSIFPIKEGLLVRTKEHKNG